jgi:hypothetical protein
LENQKAGTLANMDLILHSERIGQDGRQRQWQAPLGHLPDGAMVCVDDPRFAFLLFKGCLYRWSSAGYVDRSRKPGTVYSIRCGNMIAKS